MGRVRSIYGDSPLHLLAVLASFAVAGYAFFRIFETPTALGTLVWFAGAIVLHDLIAFPLYSALNLIADRSLGGRGEARESTRAVPLINHLRIPVFLAGLALLMFFPLILGLSTASYEKDTSLGTGVFLDRWLGLTAALFLGSALIYALRLRLAARSGREDDRGDESQRDDGSLTPPDVDQPRLDEPPPRAESDAGPAPGMEGD